MAGAAFARSAARRMVVHLPAPGQRELDAVVGPSGDRRGIAKILARREVFGHQRRLMQMRVGASRKRRSCARSSFWGAVVGRRGGGIPLGIGGAGSKSGLKKIRTLSLRKSEYMLYISHDPRIGAAHSHSAAGERKKKRQKRGPYPRNQLKTNNSGFGFCCAGFGNPSAQALILLRPAWFLLRPAWFSLRALRASPTIRFWPSGTGRR